MKLLASLLMAATLAASSLSAVAAEEKPAAAKPDLVKGEAAYAAVCAACHSPNGSGIPAQFPRLGGQHADYTAAQLVAFRDGVRTNNVHMTGVAAKLNDREIKAVSDYIAGLR